MQCRVVCRTELLLMMNVTGGDHQNADDLRCPASQVIYVVEVTAVMQQ
jgi:hypothetical protein